MDSLKVIKLNKPSLVVKKEKFSVLMDEDDLSDLLNFMHEIGKRKDIVNSRSTLKRKKLKYLVLMDEDQLANYMSSGIDSGIVISGTKP